MENSGRYLPAPSMRSRAWLLGNCGMCSGTLCRMCGWYTAKSNVGLVFCVWHFWQVAAVIRRACVG